jgi:hypothetical protein
LSDEQRCSSGISASTAPAHDRQPPTKASTPIDGARNWSRLEVAQICAAAIETGEPVIIRIDHAFPFPMTYMERFRRETWDRILDDFMRHWPTADPHTYLDFEPNDRNQNPVKER